jgi:exonuclease III
MSSQKISIATSQFEKTAILGAWLGLKERIPYPGGRLATSTHFRSLHPGLEGQFTFWDYFRQAFEHNRGIRIDHFLLPPSLADRLVSCEIDRGARAQIKPSDHAPIVVKLR